MTCVCLCVREREREIERKRERLIEMLCTTSIIHTFWLVYCFRELSISPSKQDEVKKWSPTPVSAAPSATESRNKMRSPQVPRHAIEVCNLGAFEIIGKDLVL